VASVADKVAEYGLDASIVGGDIPRLVELVSWAFDGHGDLGFGINDAATRRKFDECRAAVASPARAFLKAVAELHAIMPPEEGDQSFNGALARYPWLKALDHFEAGIADILCGSDDGTNRWEALRVAGEVRRAVSRIGSVSVPQGQRGRPRLSGDAYAMISAVCYYRHEQGMQPQYWWGEGTGSPRRRGRIDMRPIPQTEVAVLICLVAEAFQLVDTNSHLRKCLAEYRQYLKANDRAPQLSDLMPFVVEGSLEQ
jgi:hypothetical protein